MGVSKLTADSLSKALAFDTSLEVTRFLHREIDKRLPDLSQILYQNHDPAPGPVPHETAAGPSHHV